MFKVGVFTFSFFLLTAQLASACSGLGGTCVDSSDCCANLCAPTSCSNGVCIGSYCVGHQGDCQLDCQCCPGLFCGQTYPNFGRCTSLRAHLTMENCTGPVCSVPKCSIQPNGNCSICCSEGQTATCDSLKCQCSCSVSATEPLQNDGGVVISARAVPYLHATVALASLVVGTVAISAITYGLCKCRGRSGFTPLK